MFSAVSPVCSIGQVFCMRKIYRKVLYRRAKYLRICLRRWYHHNPVSNDGVHYHVEDHGVQGVSLVQTLVSLEGRGGGGGVLSPGPGYHGKLAPAHP